MYAFLLMESCVMCDDSADLFVYSIQILQLESLLLGLEQRLPQLQEDVSMLEREDDGELYSVISLQVIENELMQINQFIDRLKSTTLGHQRLSANTTQQV